jgi:RNA 3'-terminal phosphate cyclase (ATP)
MAVTIDGRFGEGGGQILRTALALASILRRPTEIRNIRGGRKRPGLRPQHLAAVKALAAVTSAEVRGAEVGSADLYFEPRRLKGAEYTLDIGTAGSTGLVLQAIMPSLLFAKGPSQVTLTGGTHVPWSPCFHYLKDVFAPAVSEMGATFSLEIGAWGWYPRGGGRVIALISPAAGLSALERTDRGNLAAIDVVSAVSNLPASVAERQRDQVLKRLRTQGYFPSRIELSRGPSPGPGTVVFVKADFEKGAAGFTSLGKRGKPAEAVADEASSAFLAFMASRAAVDSHLADQLVLYMALAHGSSCFVAEAITEHLRTNIWVIEQFLPVVFEVDNQSGKVGVEGIAFSASSRPSTEPCPIHKHKGKFPGAGSER